MKRQFKKQSIEKCISVAEKISENEKIDVEKNASKEIELVEEGQEELHSRGSIKSNSENNNLEITEENENKDKTSGDPKKEEEVKLCKEERSHVSSNRPWKRISVKKHSDHPLVGLGKGDNAQWGSMEALGIYGLLTPAIAAVPASDEFDTIHKQVREQLGQNWEIQLAAAHVDDALTGRGKHGKARSFFKKKSARRCFQILDNWWYQRFFILVILLHATAIFFEPPSAAVDNVHALVFVADAVCIVVYVLDVSLRLRFLSWPIFWSKETEERYWNGVQFVLVFLFWVDFIILCISTAVNSYIPQPFRLLRLVMLLCRLRSIRHVFEVLMIISHNLLKVLFIILIFIITFACIGVHLYMSTYNKTYKEANSTQSSKCCVAADDDDEVIYVGTFDHIGAAMLRLFVLLSTENYPEIMLPALREQKFNFFFFGVYVFFGGFFLTAILLAIVVDTYWIFAKKTVKKERARERTELAKAWNLLDPMGLGALAVTDKQFLELFRILKPKNTDEQNLMLVQLLDSQGDGEIDSFEWTTTLRRALNAEFEEEIAFEDEEGSSKVVARIRRHARSFTESATFSRAMLCLILVHGFLFCLKWKGQHYNCELGIHAMRSVVTIAFMFEITIRFVGLGKHLLHVLELTDVTLVFIAVVFNLMWYIITAGQTFKETCVIISSLSVIARWMLNSTGTRKAFRWFLDIAPVMLDLVALLFVILYLLSAIAMELFHSYNQLLEKQIYPNNCGLGFVNFWCSFLVMFQTLTTSNWHEIMNLVEKATENKVAYVFFPVSYLITTMIVMNLFVAIAIEAANKLTDNDPTSPKHRTTEQEMQKQSKSFNETAKKVLAAMVKNVFDSSRVDDRNKRQQINSPNSSTITLTGKQKKSTTIILSSPKREASGDSKPGSKDKKEESEEEGDSDDLEDYTGLSSKEKRERQLKNRMKKKRKARQKKRKSSAALLDQIQKQVRAIASFRGTQPTDLDIVVGDTITVVATRDEWIQGECKGVTGWFPASHVVNWTIKARAASGAKEQSAHGNAAATVDAFLPKEPEVRPQTPGDKATVIANSLLETKNPGSASTSLLTPQPNYRIKIKKSGDWRREILGDMTVMNAEEMRELNKVMRAELRGPRSRGSRSSVNSVQLHSPAAPRREFAPTLEEQQNDATTDSQLRPRENTFDSIRKIRTSTSTSIDVFLPDSPQIKPKIPENGVTALPVTAKETIKTIDRPSTPNKKVAESEENKKSATLRNNFPTLSVSQMATLEFSNTSESSEDVQKQSAASKDFLAIDIENKKQKPKLKATPAGEIPEWAKKFVEAKSIDMHNDVKFSEFSFNEGALPGSVHTVDADQKDPQQDK